MSALLEISAVDQIYRTGFWMKPIQVLHGVNLQVPEKSIFGFLGANGAGKTTLIQLIVGLRAPTRGQIKIGGIDSNLPKARVQIGYLPERPYFYEHLTGEGLLYYFGALAGMKRSLINSRIPEVLTAVGMSHARKLELRKYSKGMLQRIGIAQAILHDPQFLVLDEPMSGLDPVGRKEMRELITRLATEGRTIFFSSHVIPDVEAICDQVALIQKGKLIGCGPITDFLGEGPVQTEIFFRGVTLEAARGFGDFSSLRENSDGIRGLVGTQQQVEQVLRRLLDAKAKIGWVTPVRPSLESLFGGTESATAQAS